MNSGYILSSNFLSKNKQIEMYRTLNLPLVWYGCDTWSFTLRQINRIRLFEMRVLRRVFGPKREEITGTGENNIMRSLMICTPHYIRIIRLIKSRTMSWAGM
jgi:hypothetical protein